MRIGFGQILLIISIILLLFGDIKSLKKKIFSFVEMMKKNRKKGG